MWRPYQSTWFHFPCEKRSSTPRFNSTLKTIVCTRSIASVSTNCLTCTDCFYILWFHDCMAVPFFYTLYQSSTLKSP